MLTYRSIEMLTPVFELTQNEACLTIVIKAPFAKISETEVFVDETEFKFYSKPYYLRLNLPGKIIENGGEKAKYDCETGTFTLTFPKQTVGEVFEGLDMLTKLLAPSGGRSAQQSMVEIIDDSANQNAECDNIEDKDEEEEFDWQIEQEPYTGNPDIQLDAPSYGFGNLRTAVFERLQTELHDIIDLRNADHIVSAQRRPMRLADEQEHFDDEHYLSDLHENDSFTELLSYKPPWVEEYIHINSGVKADDVVTFTDEEKEKMRKLPRKEYMLDAANTQKTLLSLVDIIFAYCYNHRTTEGENTVESAWTIAKLSATLSWLECFSSLKDVAVTCHRRSLCYPLYRHWELAHKVLRDTQKIFTIGKRRLLKCLLEIHGLLMDSDQRYILNDLYITDYCVWIQSIRTRQLESLARSLKKIKVTKDDVCFDLDILEQACTLAVAENDSTNEIIDRVQHLNIDHEGDHRSAVANDDESNNLNDDVIKKKVEGGENTGEHSNEQSNEQSKYRCGKSELESFTECSNCDCRTPPNVSCDCEKDSDLSGSETSSSEYETDSDDEDSDDSSVSDIKAHDRDARTDDAGKPDTDSENLISNGYTTSDQDKEKTSNPLPKLTDTNTLNF